MIELRKLIEWWSSDQHNTMQEWGKSGKWKEGKAKLLELPFSRTGNMW